MGVIAMLFTGCIRLKSQASALCAQVILLVASGIAYRRVLYEPSAMLFRYFKELALSESRTPFVTPAVSTLDLCDQSIH